MRDELATIYALVAAVFLVAFRLDQQQIAEGRHAAQFVCTDALNGASCTCQGLEACFALGAAELCDGPISVEPDGKLGRCRIKPPSSTALVAP